MLASPVRLFSFAALSVILLFAISETRGQSQPWKQYASPEEAGFSSEKLNAVYQFADSIGSGALMVIHQGHVLMAGGDIERPFRAHSVRKSLVSALYGMAIEEGSIDLDATLQDLDIQDHAGLTYNERQARVRDIIAARSGVYLPAAYAPEDQDRKRPERGSHKPGTHWFYNNWDFNVAGTIYEQETNQDLYKAFARRIAAPLGMEDWKISDGFPVLEPSLSKHTAHTFRISTRDLARFGQLFLQEGQWNGDQIISSQWVEESTRSITSFGDGQGYGYMWWTVEKGSYAERFPGSLSYLSDYDIYLGRGSGGQGVVVIPDADIVFVHRGDTDQSRGVGGGKILNLLNMVLAAKEGKAKKRPKTQPVETVPFSSQRPRLETPKFIDLPLSHWEEFVGDYELAPEAIAKMFIYEDRPFMSIPGRGEAELFAISDSEFTVRVVSGVQIKFERDTDGKVVAVLLALGGQQMRAIKR